MKLRVLGTLLGRSNDGQKMDSEGDSEFEEKNGRKILLAKKKVPPHSGRYLAKVTLTDLPSLYIREC